MNWNQEHRKRLTNSVLKRPSDRHLHLNQSLSPEDQAQFDLAERVTAGTIRCDKLLTLKQQLVTKGFLTKAQWSFLKACMVIERE